MPRNGGQRALGLTGTPTLSTPKFVTIRPQTGAPERVSPLIRRVLAGNPGPFTGWGTGTYIVGEGEVAVIDPGPDDPA